MAEIYFNVKVIKVNVFLFTSYMAVKQCFNYHWFFIVKKKSLKVFFIWKN